MAEMAGGAETACQSDLGERQRAVADQVLRLRHSLLHHILMRSHIQRLAEHTGKMKFTQSRLLRQVGQWSTADRDERQSSQHVTLHRASPPVTEGKRHCTVE